MTRRIWDDVIGERDRQVYEKSGWAQRVGLGRKPAILVVDVTYDFTGDVPEPILQSIEKFPMSCGEAAWESMPHLQRLLEAARAAGAPVIYTRGVPRPDRLRQGNFGRKNATASNRPEISLRIGREFPSMIAPQPGDIVIQKEKPSAFFGTPLGSYLVALGVDTVIVTGTTTSGCGRATGLDASSHNYRVAVVEECTFDRGVLSHKVNLFDM
ncbi:MAG: isochorismatase family protein, partial [Armatimonadetes bacterium]|nr:isochorismatase family protein [Armatimonadota bacterium]